MVAVIPDLALVQRPRPLRLAFAVLLLPVMVPNWPWYVSPTRSLKALSRTRGVEFPEQPPVYGPSFYYPWADYRATILHLRRTLPPRIRVANALSGMPAVTGPVGRLPAFPGESLAWFQYFKNRPELEESYLKRLHETPESVLVWAPAEKGKGHSIVPERLTDAFESAYEPEARFGSIEIWRRKAPPVNSGGPGIRGARVGSGH